VLISGKGSAAQLEADERAPEGPPLRANWRAIKRIYGDARGEDRIRAHYLLERSLAWRLRRSTRAERKAGLLYTELYDALLSQLPDHPRKALTATSIQKARNRQIRLLRARLSPNDGFLEIGGGACQVALGISPYVAEAIVVDVTDELVPADHGQEKFKFLKTEGVVLPLPNSSVSFVYSNQLMEHLHPDDAAEQLKEILRVLASGGRYFCRTPSKYTGPHDVSKYFSDTPEGMHICEYGYRDIAELFSRAGFRSMRVELTPAGIGMGRLPLAIAAALEASLDALSPSMRRGLARTLVLRAIMGVSVMAIK